MKNKAKTHLLNRQVATLAGKTGRIYACYHDGSLGVWFDDDLFLSIVSENSLYFPHLNTYNQKCFN
jgi:hypothetical protein